MERRTTLSLQTHYLEKLEGRQSTPSRPPSACNQELDFYPLAPPQAHARNLAEKIRRRCLRASAECAERVELLLLIDSTGTRTAEATTGQLSRQLCREVSSLYCCYKMPTHNWLYGKIKPLQSGGVPAIQPEKGGLIGALFLKRNAFIRKSRKWCERQSA